MKTMKDRLAGHHARVTSVGAALMACLACSSSAGSYDFVHFGVSSSDGQGQTTSLGCTALPVLWGTEVRETYQAQGGVEVQVRAYNREVQVVFSGVDGADVRQRFELGELTDGFSEAVEIRARGGARMRVHFSVGCSG